MLDEQLYGVWIVNESRFEDEAAMKLDDAMSLALFCCESDDLGHTNYLVMAIDDAGKPITHDIPWCGQFHGFEHLYHHCVITGKVNPDEAEFLL